MSEPTAARHTIPMTRVSSRLLSAYGYDVDREVFAATYATSGATYYYRVPLQLFEQFLASESKGRFVLQHIQPRQYIAKFEQEADAQETPEVAS